jgi:integrase
LTREWQHVDFKAGTLRLEPHETKNDEGRTFPLGTELLAVLHGQRQRCDQLERTLGRIVPWVFFTPQGKRITHYQRAWDKARKAAGLPHKLLYDCRRTRVRNFERAGVSRSAGKALVGHRTDAMYARYAITDEAMLREAVAKADSFERVAGQGRVKVARLGKK